MERERAREIVNRIVDHAKETAKMEGHDEYEDSFALGYLMVVAENCLCLLREDDIERLYLDQEV